MDVRNPSRRQWACALCLPIFALFAGACHRKTMPQVAVQPVPQPAATATEPALGRVPPPVYLVASLEKTGCYGNCPVFEAQVFSDGAATYFGQKHAPRTGRFTAKVRPALAMELVKRAEVAGFFGLETLYPTSGRRVADFPTTIIYVRDGQKERRIEDNFDAPLHLQEFERYFSEWLEKLAWQKQD